MTWRSISMNYKIFMMLVFACLCNPIVEFGMASEGDELDSIALLNEMKAARSKISNISYIVEYNDFQTKQTIKKIVEELKKRGGLSKEQIEKLSAPHMRQVQSWLLDSRGLSKCIMDVMQRFDSSGKLFSEKSEPQTHSWDGSTYFYYQEYADGRKYGSISGKASVFLTKQRRVDKLFGGGFVGAFEKAIAAEVQIDVSRISKSGEYRIAFTDAKYKRIAIIDPSKGFSCTSEEWYKDGKILIRRTAKYSQVDEGIWFPEKGKTVMYLPNGNEKSRTAVQVKKVKVNGPKVCKASFQIKFPEGTFVEDKIIKLKAK